MLHSKLTAALSRSGERGASRFLALHPEVLVWVFCKTGGHSCYAVKEFPFGSSYRADFVVALSYSGAWEVHLIELEPVNDRVITKKGLASARLNSAISQLNDWRAFIEANRALVQQDLARWCMTKDLLDWHSHDHSPRNFTGDELHDAQTHVWFHYHIVIGRRAIATRDVRRKMNQYCSGGYISIGTYDRFIDVAENCDRFRANPNVSVRLPETRDESDGA